MNRHLIPQLLQKAEKPKQILVDDQDNIDYLITHYKQHKNKKLVIEKLPIIFDKFRKKSIFDTS